MFDARVRSIFDALPSLVGYTDRELRCQYANRLYAEFIGKPGEWFVGRPIREIWGDRVVEEFAPYIAEALDGARVEFNHHLADWKGRSYDLAASMSPQFEQGRTVGYILVVTDVTEATQARRRAERDARFIQEVIDACPVDIHVKDRERRYVLVNRAFRERIAPGLDPIGKRVEDLRQPGPEGQAVARAEEQLLRSGQGRFEMERLYGDGDPEGHGRRWCRVVKVPLVGRDEPHLVTSIVDIHDYKTANARLDATVRDRDRLIMELDHRVNDMLQVIRSIIGLESQSARDGAAAELLDALGRRVAALGAVYGLLRADAASPRPVGARYAAERVLEACELDAALHIDEGLAIPASQLDAFVFILEELVRNACRHGTKASVRLSGDGTGGLLLEVRDRGPGLPPGASVDGSESVGFTLVSSFAQGCGAGIGYSFEGGALFTVSFPPVTPAPRQGPEAGPEAAESGRGG